jgi:iron-sulfur cluster assembly protein
MAVQLTESARQRVTSFLARDGGIGLRLGVRKTGCSGWAYIVDLVKEIDDEDTVFEDSGVTIVVDKKSLPLVDGTRIDFVVDGLNRTFRFSNPNVTDECGCGESFSVTGVAVTA